MDRERLPGESRSQRWYWAVRVVDSRGGGSFIPKICGGEGEANIWAERNHIPGGYMAEPHQVVVGEMYSVDGKRLEHGGFGKGGDNLHHHGPSVSPRFMPDQDIF